MESSQIPIDSLISQVIENYPEIEAEQIRLLNSGVHEHYLVEGKTRRYVLRVYHHHWRTIEEAFFELELLEHLHRNNCPVVASIKNRHGHAGSKFRIGDEKRLAAIFLFIEGMPPGNAITSEHAYKLGSALASIHQAGMGFQSVLQRQRLDKIYLLDTSVKSILPWLTSLQQQTLRQLYQAINKSWPEFPSTAPNFTVCHGDPNSGNFLIDIQGTLTLIDFDQCGPGWRIFDIAKFAASQHRSGNLIKLVNACLDGYQAVTPLENDEIISLPVMAQAAALWVAAIQVYNEPITGERLHDRDAWQKRLDTIQSLPELLTG